MIFTRKKTQNIYFIVLMTILRPMEMIKEKLNTVEK